MELRGGFIRCMPGGMLVDPGEVGLALDAQLVLRWRFLVAGGFCGLSGQAWQARKYSVGRDNIQVLILRACDAFGPCGFLERGGWQLLVAANGSLRLGFVDGLHLYAGEAVTLQDVVGERVPEHDGADLFDAAHGQLPQVPVAPAGMDALTNRTGLVSGLALFARHSRAVSYTHLRAH